MFSQSRVKLRGAPSTQWAKYPSISTTKNPSKTPRWNIYRSLHRQRPDFEKSLSTEHVAMVENGQWVFVGVHPGKLSAGTWKSPVSKGNVFFPTFIFGFDVIDLQGCTFGTKRITWMKQTNTTWKCVKTQTPLEFLAYQVPQKMLFFKIKHLIWVC